jgi:hypothetical protein
MNTIHKFNAHRKIKKVLSMEIQHAKNIPRKKMSLTLNQHQQNIIDKIKQLSFSQKVKNNRKVTLRNNKREKGVDQRMKEIKGSLKLRNCFGTLNH